MKSLHDCRSSEEQVLRHNQLKIDDADRVSEAGCSRSAGNACAARA